MNSLNRFADPVYCVVRLIVGLAYACHGGQKLLGYPGGGHGVDGLAFIAGIIELVGGFLIAFGLFTRIAAFLASGEMAVAYFMFYVGVVPTLEAKFFPIMNGGELALLYCWFLFDYLPRSGTLEHRCAVGQKQRQRAVRLIQTWLAS